ncbi:MAG TPA: methyltransferase domain-containing protein [Polyangiaceae bacterium]|jgi:cyclopropane fatty-acyl-phospholipid synthase-like methyltransferase|nr:methyltransferase domain-containing protein [Polyangiaceae bacterium]
MTSTPQWQIDRVREYYLATTAKSYLDGWAKGSLGFHFGLADESTRSHEQSLLATNEYLAGRAKITAGTRILDAGCGVGGSSLYLAQSLGARAVGVSLVQEQIAVARELARERGLQEVVAFECVDMLDTPFPARSFDVVWNIESLCHVVDAGAYFAHVLELLDDGGRFACIDLCRAESCDEATERLVTEGWALAPLRTPAAVVSALNEAGFVEVEHVDLTARAMLSAQALKAAASQRLLTLRAERAFAGKEEPLYEAHCRAALAMVEGMESGQTAVSHFLAVRPPR